MSRDDFISTEALRFSRRSVVDLTVESLDVFLTYRCGFRCSHCFLGSSLDSNEDMPFDSLRGILQNAHQWSTKHVTFLGGEPTMYPRFLDAVALARQEGYQVRVVTNGHVSLRRYLDATSDRSVSICFSIDGANAEIHDRIRIRGSFDTLLCNVSRARALGHRVAGIIAVSRDNSECIRETLVLCDEIGFEYVNLHYVTARGFAKRSSVLSIDEWLRVCEVVEATARRIRMEVRLERTFFEALPNRLNCAVRERSNLMFLPDGRVFMCMMFIDSEESHSYYWNGRSLVRNSSVLSEEVRVEEEHFVGCPAMEAVNPDVASEARNRGLRIQCIYCKERPPAAP